MSKHNYHPMKSALGAHFAGSGIAGFMTWGQHDCEVDKVSYTSSSTFVKLPTDDVWDNRKAFDEYCKQQSGEVITYKLEDLKEGAY